jgi:Fe-S oxidoreductase
MGHESLIMQQSDIGAIANSVKDCLRCGKCKPVCSTHVPRANLLYSPRNKILATSLLVEAFLYEEQTRRGVSIKHWEEFEDVADHCTVCHKCVTPCPVNIDFGDVSMNMRNLLRKMGKKSFNPAPSGHVLPQRHRPGHHQRHPHGHGGGLQGAAPGQRPAEEVCQEADQQPPATVGKPPVKEQVIHFINKKMPGNLPKKTARALLDIEDDKIVPIIRNPRPPRPIRKRCSTSRAAARSACSRRWAWPRRPCCGMSACRPCCRRAICAAAIRSAAGQFDKAEKMITDNRVLFHRVANTLNYLDIKTVVVSCGTCYDQLQGYQFEKIFPAAASSTSTNTCWKRASSWKA